MLHDFGPKAFVREICIGDNQSFARPRIQSRFTTMESDMISQWAMSTSKCFIGGGYRQLYRSGGSSGILASLARVFERGLHGPMSIKPCGAWQSIKTNAVTSKHGKAGKNCISWPNFEDKNNINEWLACGNAGINMRWNGASKNSSGQPWKRRKCKPSPMRSSHCIWGRCTSRAVNC